MSWRPPLKGRLVQVIETWLPLLCHPSLPPNGSLGTHPWLSDVHAERVERCLQVTSPPALCFALLARSVPVFSAPLLRTDSSTAIAVAGLQPIQRRDLVSQSMLEVFTFHESHLVTDPKLVGIVALATRFVLLGSPAQVRCSASACLV